MIIKPRTDETEFDVDMLVDIKDVADWKAADYLDAFHKAFKNSETDTKSWSRPSRQTPLRHHRLRDERLPRRREYCPSSGLASATS